MQCATHAGMIQRVWQPTFIRYHKVEYNYNYKEVADRKTPVKYSNSYTDSNYIMIVGDIWPLILKDSLLL